MASKSVSAPTSVIPDGYLRRSPKPPPICSAMGTSPISKNARARIVFCTSMTRRRITAGGGAIWPPAVIGRRRRLFIKDKTRNRNVSERPNREFLQFAPVGRHNVPNLLNNQQGRCDLPAFALGEAGFVDLTRLLPGMAQLREISSPRQHAACRLEARPLIFMPPTAVDGQEIFRPLSG